MERQTEPLINQNTKKKKEKKKEENQKTTMAYTYIEIKERIEREKKKRTSRRKRWETRKHHCTGHRRRVTAGKAIGMDGGKFS